MAVCVSCAGRRAVLPMIKLCQQRKASTKGISILPAFITVDTRLNNFTAARFKALPCCGIRLQVVKEYCSYSMYELSVYKSAMCEEKSAEDVLNQLHALSSSPTITTTTITIVTDQLLTAMYRDLATEHKWLLTTIPIAYIQLLLEGIVEELTAPVRQHPHFNLLYKLFDENFMDFSNEQLTQSLLNLLYLGVLSTDQLVTKMLIECKARIPYFDFIALKNMSFVTYVLSPVRDFLSRREIIKRWKQMMEDDALVWTPEIVRCHCMVGLNHLGILSPKMQNRATEKVLKALKANESLLQEPEVIGTVLRFARKMRRKHQGPALVPQEITSLAAAACPTVIQKYEAHHIAETCSSLKFLKCYNEKMSSIFEQRALELLNNECHLRDVINLLHSFSRHSSKFVKSKFLKALHSSLLTTEPDLILLSNIADNFILMGNVPDSILILFQKAVAEKAGKIVSHQSRYHRIAKYLCQTKFLEEQHEAMFIEKILEKLERTHGINMPISASLTAFLFTHSEEALSDKLFETLIKEIPNWFVVGPFYPLATGINHMPMQMSGQLQIQVSEIQAAVYSNLIEKMNDCPSLDKLYKMTTSLVVNCRNRDPFFTDRIMHMYVKFTKSLLSKYDNESFGKICTVFDGIRYSLPEVFDDLSNCLTKHWDQANPEKVAMFLKACANVGYLPERSDVFLETVLKSYNVYKEEDNIVRMLSILYHLSLLQLLPEKELSDLFTLEFIEKIDKFVSENPEHKKNVEHFILSLNRTVVVECPQLDVPWFHNFDSDLLTLDAPKFPWFISEVRECLVEILGGSSFVESPSYSYYGNPMSFEIHLDSAHKPLPVLSEDQQKDKRDINRIAIQMYGKRSYCFNSIDVRGWQKTNRRQLEIMGYQVSEIPHFEWFSMSLADHKSKLDYLKGKIYDQQE